MFKIIVPYDPVVGWYTASVLWGSSNKPFMQGVPGNTVPILPSRFCVFMTNFASAA